MPTMKTLTIGGTTYDLEGGVTSVNGQTGAVVLGAADVGAATEQDIADAIIQVLPVDSVSGSIASFPDGYPAPVEALSCAITPVQDLNGYDNPWPAGGGKNLLNNTATTTTSNGVTFTVNADGSISCSGTANGGTAVLRIFQTFSIAENIILSGCPSGGDYNNGYSLMACNSTGSAVSGDYPTSCDEGSGVTITAVNIPNIAQIQIIVRNGTNMTGKVFYPMIRLASVSDSSYAPYSNICPISGWTEARIWCEATHDTSAAPKVTIDLSGTRYGGTLDVKSGVLTVTKATVTFSGADGEGWAVYSSSAFYADISGKADGYGTSICDRYKNLNDAAWVSNLFSVYSDHPSLNRIYVRPPYDGFTMTTTAWREWLASNPLTFCYDLATPLSVQLTPAQLFDTLYGNNSVWANCGDVSVTYRADIQKYIDKKLS